MSRFEKLRAFLSEKEGRILSSRELAGLLGVTHTTITRVEKGEIDPSPKVARALAAKYKISESWYLTGKGPAPWEPEQSIEWQVAEKQLAKGEFGGALHLAGAEIKSSSHHKLIEHWIRAGRDPFYREALYNVIERSRIVDTFLELRRELAELQAGASGLDTVSPPAVTKSENKYGPKAAPSIRLTADNTFESTEVSIELPDKPSKLSPDDSHRWDINLSALERYAATERAKKDWPRGVIPSGIAARFCREVVGFYEGGRVDDVGGILWDYLTESGSQYTGVDRRKQEA